MLNVAVFFFFFFSSLKQVKLKDGGLQLRSRFSSHCSMGNVSFITNLYGQILFSCISMTRFFLSKMF